MATSTLGSGTLVLAGTTSGTTTVTATAVAGTTTLTLPAATDTLVGKATTDTLTNKTLTGAAMNGTLGATTASTANVTTLTTSSTITHNGGTANGVAYLNGSKVLTTGSALVFDGTNLGVGVTPSAWGGSFKALQVGLGTSLYNNTNGNGTFLGSNFYWNGSNNIYINSDYATAYSQNLGVHAWYTAPSGTAGNTITFTQAMTLDASGQLGIGTTTPDRKLTLLVSPSTAGDDGYKISDGTRASTFARTGATYSYQGVGVNSTLLYSSNTLCLLADGSSVLSFHNGNGETARIDTSGNLLIGKTALNSAVGTSIDANTSTGIGVRVVSSSSTTSADGFQMYSTGAAAYRFYVSFNGTISATNTTISSLSDQRHKENIRNLNVGLAEVMALKPRLFDWKEGKGADIKNARGFIAQEFEEVFPDLIDEWKDPAPEGEEPYKSVRQDLIPVLVKAIQEQQALIQTLTARITALESA